MEYETEEQQVEALKEWWNENGKAVIAGVVLGGAAIGGWTFWQDRTEKQAIAASDSFSQAIEAVNSDDSAAVINLADVLADDHPDHLYAAYTNLAAARAAVVDNNLELAANKLSWVAENAPQNDVKLIAKVRLARVKGAAGDAKAGLAELPKSFPESFTGLVEEARGDLLVLEGDWSAARSAYEAAASSQFVANREGLTMKLNELAVPGENGTDESDSTS